MSELASLFEQKRALIDGELAIFLPEAAGPLKRLSDAARYALLGPGKRLRPLLALMTCTALHGIERSALPAACALEMIHAYSMIHDDLPCMDDDDFRRGRPTLHRMFPEGHAVLTGDFLLTKAFEIVATTPLLNPVQKVGTLALLAKRSGDEGMLGGQIMDVEAEGEQIELATLQKIHKGKTGALIAAACECGGIAAGASVEVLALLHTIGEQLGLAFQIVDDVLDVIASEQKHGYQAASDERNAKVTYVTLLGVEGARHEADLLLQTCCRQLEQLPGNTEALRALARLLIHRVA